MIGAFFGFVLGFLFDLFIQKRVKKKQTVLRGKASEVIIIVQCEENQKEQVEHILWGHLALGVAITV
ncbi:hypothetical protein AAAC51_19210 [Priestia megaterium]